MSAPEDSSFHWESLAVIREEDCIGCALCLKVCPVDAILGAIKRIHTVIAHECTGCALCVPVCPVDCIEMHPAGVMAHAQARRLPYPAGPQIERAQARMQTRLRRLSAFRRPARKNAATRRREVLAAIARVRARGSVSRT
jgi:electron transport complex protein RnfB